MMMWWGLALLLVRCINADKTLVFVDGNHELTYGDYFSDLKNQGHELSIHPANDKSIVFNSYGDYHFDNVIIFSPGSKEIASITWSELHAFIQTGGNVLLAASTKLTKTQRKFAAECGVEFDKKSSIVMDHFNFADDTDHTRIYTAQYNVQVMRSTSGQEYQGKQVLFQGIGQLVDEQNILTLELLKPSDSAYSAVPTKDVKTFHPVALVTAVQARNNARMVFSGSLELFTNENWRNSKLANQLFARDLSKWVFGRTGVLQVSNIQHSRFDGFAPEKMLSEMERPDQPISLYPDAEITRDTLVYRIKDNLTFSMDVHEFRDNRWNAFQADDMQLEFVMLDPYVRKTMTHDTKGHFSVTFESPDAYGVFQFRVMYRRPGYTTIHETRQVSLRPYKHDEYERFIFSAYPYYASAISMMLGVFVLSGVFLYSQH